MISLHRVLATGGAVSALMVASAGIASAAPSRPVQGTTPAAAAVVAAAPTTAGPTSTGHIFGVEMRTIARAIPAGPDHGRLVSAFARANNPSNFKSHGKGHPATPAGNARGHRGASH